MLRLLNRGSKFSSRFHSYNYYCKSLQIRHYGESFERHNEKKDVRQSELEQSQELKKSNGTFNIISLIKRLKIISLTIFWNIIKVLVLIPFVIFIEYCVGCIEKCLIFLGQLIRDNTKIEDKNLLIFLSELFNCRTEKFVKILDIIQDKIPQVNLIIFDFYSLKLYINVSLAAYYMTKQNKSEDDTNKANTLLSYNKFIFETQINPTQSKSAQSTKKLFNILASKNSNFPTLYVQTLYHLYRLDVNKNLYVSDEDDKILKKIQTLIKLREIIDSNPLIANDKFNAGKVKDSILVQRQTFLLRRLLKAQANVVKYDYNNLKEIFNSYNNIASKDDDDIHREICERYALITINTIGDNFVIYPKLLLSRKVEEKDTSSLDENTKESTFSLDDFHEILKSRYSEINKNIDKIEEEFEEKNLLNTYRTIPDYIKFFINFYYIRKMLPLSIQNENEKKVDDEILSNINHLSVMFEKFTKQKKITSNEISIRNYYFYKLEFDLLKGNELDKLSEIECYLKGNSKLSEQEENMIENIKEDEILCKKLERILSSHNRDIPVCNATKLHV